MERVGMIGLHPNPVRTGVHLSVNNARKPCPVLGILGKKKGNRSRKPLICRPFVYLSRQPCSATPAPLREVVCAAGKRGYRSQRVRTTCDSRASVIWVSVG